MRLGTRLVMFLKRTELLPSHLALLSAVKSRPAYFGHVTSRCAFLLGSCK